MRDRPPRHHAASPPGPRGPLSWARRKPIPVLAMLSAMAGIAVVVFWLTGRVLTDRFGWSQYLWWVPPLWALIAMWGAWLLSAVLGKLARRPGGVLLRPLLLAMCVGCSVYVVFGVWRMHRVFLSPRPPAGVPALRVLHWNQSAYKAGDDVAPSIITHDADLVLIVNSRRNRNRIALVQRLAEVMAPSETEYRVASGIKARFQPDHFTVQGEALVASKLPILRTGTAWLGRVVDPEQSSRPTGQHGWVMFIELDLREKYPDGPGSMIVWLVDLPSEPTLWRVTSMQAAVDAVNRWNGVTRVSDGQGNWTGVPTDSPFPPPDLVIGDFNTLRGSSSLEILVPSMRDAFAQSGHGRGRSWVPRVKNRWLRQPLKLADWHIDLAMTGHGWRSAAYRLLDAPVGPHEIQVVDLVPTGEEN